MVLPPECSSREPLCSHVVRTSVLIMTTTSTGRQARDIRGTAEYVAAHQDRLGAIARRAQIGLDLELELDLSGVGEGRDGQLDLFS